jgi:hypothetical protein
METQSCEASQDQTFMEMEKCKAETLQDQTSMETETCEAATPSCEAVQTSMKTDTREAATPSCEAAVQYIQNSMEYEAKFSSAIVMTMSDAVVPQKLIDLNKVDGVYLAGGALTRFVLNTEFDLPPFSEIRVAKHDLDFFVVGPTQEIREERMREFLVLVGGKVSRSNMHMADVVQEDGCRLQVIMTNYETIQKVVTHFDFSLSRFWLASNNEIKATSSAFMSIRDKINVVTTKHQSVSRERIEKYQRLFQLKTVVDNEDKLVDGENVVTTEEVDMTCAFTPLPKTYKNYYGLPNFKFVAATHCVIDTPEDGRVHFVWMLRQSYFSITNLLKLFPRVTMIVLQPTIVQPSSATSCGFAAMERHGWRTLQFCKKRIVVVTDKSQIRMVVMTCKRFLSRHDLLTKSW